MNDQFLIQFEGNTQMMTADDELHAARRVLMSREDLPRGRSYEVRVIACPPFAEGTPFSVYVEAVAKGRVAIVDVAEHFGRGSVTARWA